MTKSTAGFANNAALHSAIIGSFIEKGYAPNIDDLAALFELSRPEIVDALLALQNYHGVVLHPKSNEIWIAHPFSAAPAGYVVRKGEREWWGSCAWCSFGVVTLLGGTASIHAMLGNTTQASTIRIENDVLLDTDVVVHFPIDMSKAWDNVQYTCSMMMFFPSEKDVDDWCTNHNVRKGDVRPAQQIWDFSRDWYGSHASPDWRKWTAAEASRIFEKHGLSGAVWALDGSEERF
ncbi:MAG: alkylmercury lyase family protein [Planctomycetota bacterium]